jgi:hypothetical protein
LDSQRDDGAWGPDDLRWRDTAAVLATLSLYDQERTAYVRGRAFLDSLPAINHDLLARRAAVEALAGDAAGASVNALLAGRTAACAAGSTLVNCPEGGWGLGLGYQSDTLDTALALLGLAEAGRTAAQLAQPIAYLRGTQNADGGWGTLKGADSFLFTTLHVLLALQRYRQSPDPNIPNGVTWLKARQRADGGFASDAAGPSNAAETSLAYLVLRAENPVPAAAGTALSWIRANQRADGSWNGSPYETALALRALLVADPAALGDAAPPLVFDPAVTAVVDAGGGGTHTTIQAAVDAVRGRGSADVPFRILVVPAAVEYPETVDISGLSWTTIEGLGGATAVRGVKGCASATGACDHVTLANLKFSGSLTFGDPATGAAYYSGVKVEDIVVEYGVVRFAASADPARVPDFELSGSWIHGAPWAPDLSVSDNRQLVIGKDVPTPGTSPDGFIRGTVRDSRIEKDLCYDGGAVLIQGIGGNEDSLVVFENNELICRGLGQRDLQAPGGRIVTLQQGGGRAVFSDNRFAATLAGAPCPTGCSHQVIGVSSIYGSGSENDSHLYLLNNVLRVGVSGAGNSNSRLQFVALRDPYGFGQFVRGQQWFLSGNVFELVRTGSGDLPDSAARDIFTSAADATVVVRHRDQELRYGVETNGGSVDSWPTDTVLAPAGTFDVDLTGPTTQPATSIQRDGQIWADGITQKLCYRAQGLTRCVTGVVPASTMRLERVGLTAAHGDLACTVSGRLYRGQADVRVVDRRTGLPIANATVVGDWSGATSGTGFSGITGSNGIASILSATAGPGSVFTFTVTSVSHASFTYAPTENFETSDSTPACGS